MSDTNDGDFQGTAPTGKHASWFLEHVFTLRDGEIVADVTVLDRLGLLEQLGPVPGTVGVEQ